MGRRVAVLLHHGLGDVIMSHKLIRNLESYFAEDHVTLIVKSGVEKKFLDLLNLNENVEIVVLNYTGTFKSKVSIMLRFFSLGLKKFDLLLAAHSSNKRLGNIFSRLINAKVSIGPKSGKHYNATAENRDQHKQEYYMSFLETYWERFESDRKHQFLEQQPIQLSVNDFPSKYSSIIEGDYLIISPGTSPFDTHKRWSKENYISLIQEILEKYNHKIILLGTKSDNEVLNAIYETYEENNRVQIVNDLSIKHAMHFMSKSNVIISACTSSLHMAALVDASMVSIYGPTNYSITGPVSRKNRIVRMGYACSPCFRDSFQSGCGTPKCMTDISVKSVYSAVEKSLEDEPWQTYPDIATTSAKKFFAK